jgi:cellulose synthase/poly-beta-1,6-N-acetylglucosamine synthase-like glycosyltransferase
VIGLVHAIAWFSLAYFAAVNLIYLGLTVLAWQGVADHVRSRPFAAVDELFASPLTPGISILLPAYNEEAGIVPSIHSLFGLRYPLYEVVVVSDGSTDRTIEVLREAFELVEVEKVLRTMIPTAPVRATYVSRRHPSLVVIDKENGGKADALNAGTMAARYPFVCSIDADSVIEEDALLRVVKPILDDPELVVATGGMVRIANGCTVDHGRVVDVALPRNRLAILQVVEYFRAFFVGRSGWNRLNALFIISGAFGLFRRSVVEAAGGWWTGTVGDDMELVVRLHRYLRDRNEPYRIDFVPDPVCWTEAPESLRTLYRQRKRWQRAVAETVWRHRRLVGNPRYGLLGLVAWPYVVVFELLGPLFELSGYVLVPVVWGFGLLSTSFLVAFLVLSLLLGILISVAALALEEVGFRRHPRAQEVARMLAYALVENLGYRQLTNVWRLLAFVDLVRGNRSWGAQVRKGFAPSES